MPKVRYGKTEISYQISIEPDLKHHYIQVEQGSPILFRSSAITEEEANKLVLKKARWILQKLALVAEPIQSEIVTGSRLAYFGKRYYTSLKKTTAQKASIAYKSGQIEILVPNKSETTQEELNTLLEEFYRQKCIEKITPRFQPWIKQTGLQPSAIQFRKLEKRWGTCTKDHKIILSLDCAKLPWQLIDYLILHELTHIKHADHTKAFWNEIERHMPNYKQHDQRLDMMEF